MKTLTEAKKFPLYSINSFYNSFYKLTKIFFTNLLSKSLIKQNLKGYPITMEFF